VLERVVQVPWGRANPWFNAMKAQATQVWLHFHAQRMEATFDFEVAAEIGQLATQTYCILWHPFKNATIRTAICYRL